MFSLLPRFTASEYPLVFSNFWPLYFLILPRFTVSDYPFGIFKHLSILFHLFRLTTYDNPCVIFKPLAIIYVLRFTVTDYPFGIIRLLASALSFLLRLTASDYFFGILKPLAIEESMLLQFTHLITPLVSSNIWPLRCLSFLDLRLIITLWYLQTFGHYICLPFFDLRFWLHLWYLQTFGHCVVCPSIYDLWLFLWYLQIFDHCIFCSSIYGCWLPLLENSNFSCILCLTTIIYITSLLRACILYQRNQVIFIYRWILREMFIYWIFILPIIEIKNVVYLFLPLTISNGSKSINCKNCPLIRFKLAWMQTTKVCCASTFYAICIRLNVLNKVLNNDE